MESSAIKILVLEDDDDMRELLEDLLAEQGYQVTAVARGEDAVARAASQAYDLFVADIRMEGMSGLQAIEKARAHQPQLGSLVVSGWASEQETLEAVRLNVGAYLKKPFAVADFLAQVKTLLEKRLRDEQGEEKAHHLKAIALWSLQTLVDVCDQAALLGPQGTLAFAGNLAAELARQREFSAEVIGQVALGAQLAGLLELTEHTPPTEFAHEPALGTLFLLLHSEAGEEPEVAEIRQLARLALEAALAADGPTPPSAQRLRELLPEDFSQELLELYSRIDRRRVPSSKPAAEVRLARRDPTRLHRSLLSLAQTLERSGDTASAVAAYRKVLDEKPSPRWASAASLGLARLAQQENRSQEAAEWALRSASEARLLGPQAFAESTLKCGLLLRELGDSRADQCLATAAENLKESGAEALWAATRLALAHQLNQEELLETLGVLARPAHLMLTDSLADWLLPTLLETLPNCPTEVADRLILAFPGRLSRLWTGLSEPAQLALLKVFERNLSRTPPGLLERLSSSAHSQVVSKAAAVSAQLSGRPAVPMLRMQSLGFFQVCLGDLVVDEKGWRTQKTKYLLAYLADQNGRPVLAEKLVELFWPESGEKGPQNLWAATSAVRRVLRPGDFLLREGESLILNPQLPHWHDVEHLEQALEAWQGSSSGQRMEVVRRINALYAGPYLDGCYLDWAVQRRQSLENRVVDALLGGAAAALQQRNYQSALELSRGALELDNLRTKVHLLKMRAHLGLGQPEAAISQYEKCVIMLRDEFQAEPPMELIEVYTRARHGLPDVAAE